MSVLPRCGRLQSVLDAGTLSGALGEFLAAALDAGKAIFTSSYLSLNATAGLVAMCWALARGGGIGAVQEPEVPPGGRQSFLDSLPLWCGPHEGAHYACQCAALCASWCL